MNKNLDSISLEQELSFLSPYFLGSHGENSKVLEELLVEFVRDHIYWRRNYHPDDTPPVTAEMLQSTHYRSVIETMTQELRCLTAKLKHTIPIFNPRYIGQMSSDLMLPALLAQLVTTFYNPNNCAIDGAEVTIDMELEVGNQFAAMFGFNTDANEKPCAWGHLTSGGSDANYESLWNFRAVKYYPVALFEALRQMKIEVDLSGIIKHDVANKTSDYTPWQLINLSIDDVLDLRSVILNKIQSQLGLAAVKEFIGRVEDNRLETLGPAQFFGEHWKFHQPVVLVPATAHVFWEKAMRLLGFGSASLIRVPLTNAMRMDEHELERILNNLCRQNIPVLAVVGVIGSVEFGAIDPIHALVKLQQQFAQQGFQFYLHVDASRGGYFKALFKDPGGKDLSRDAVKSGLTHFPSHAIYDAFIALAQVDSITVAPHSFGYLPQGIGGFITRNREIVKLLNHSEKIQVDNLDTLDLSQLNHFILDGAKPGANAAAAYLTHKTLPLNANCLGRVVKQTIRSAEYFDDEVKKLAQRLDGKVHLCVPFEPDTNLVTIAINPVANQSLQVMNRFMDQIYQALAFEPQQIIQTRNFLGSQTQLKLNDLSNKGIQNLFNSFHLEFNETHKYSEETFHILRHVVMNPWLGAKNNGLNYLDQYIQFLELTIIETLKNHNDCSVVV